MYMQEIVFRPPLTSATDRDVIYVHEGTYDVELVINGVDVHIIAVREVIINYPSEVPYANGIKTSMF